MGGGMNRALRVALMRSLEAGREVDQVADDQHRLVEAMKKLREAERVYDELLRSPEVTDAEAAFLIKQMGKSEQARLSFRPSTVSYHSAARTVRRQARTISSAVSKAEAEARRKAG
jgi:hypothetical protein